MSEKYDVIIIGGGNAGFAVSAVVHEAGKSIAFVEEWDFGGTCPNRGCTPKKVLVAAGCLLDGGGLCRGSYPQSQLRGGLLWHDGSRRGGYGGV